MVLGQPDFADAAASGSAFRQPDFEDASRWSFLGQLDFEDAPLKNAFGRADFGGRFAREHSRAVVTYQQQRKL